MESFFILIDHIVMKGCELNECLEVDVAIAQEDRVDADPARFISFRANDSLLC